MSTPIPTAIETLPDLVVATYGNGRVEARIRSTSWVVREAADINTLIRELKRVYPGGFRLDIRYDPHM
jgi:hypothetical protein